MAETVPPAGPAIALVGLIIAMLVLTWLIVIVRFAVRHAIHAIGLDDYLMALGLVFFTIFCGVVVTMCYYGGGHLTSDVPTDTFMLGMQYFLVAQLTNVILTIPVKCSICCTLLRISESKLRFSYTLYAIMALTVATAISCFIAILLVCRPLPAFWGGTEGTCNANASSSIGYLLSAVSIATDWTLALLPAIMLWNVQLKRRIKISIAIILSLGALASVGPIVRLQYLIRYGDPNTILYNGAKIATWTVVEFGIGISAGSMAQLRPLLRYIPHLSSSYVRSSSDHPSRTLHGRSGNIRLSEVHKERKMVKGSDSTRRIYGRDELDLHDTDVDSQEERLNSNTSSGQQQHTSWPLTDSKELANTIHKETEVTIQPFSADQDLMRAANSTADGVQSPDFTFRDTGYCKTEVWHRDSRC